MMAVAFVIMEIEKGNHKDRPYVGSNHRGNIVVGVYQPSIIGKIFPPYSIPPTTA